MDEIIITRETDFRRFDADLFGELIVCYRSDNLIVTFINNAACSTFNIMRDTTIGRSLLDVTRELGSTLTPNERLANLKRLNNVGLGMAVYSYIVGGQELFIRWMAHAPAANDGGVVEYQIIGTNITDMVHDARQLALREQQLYKIIMKVLSPTKRTCVLLSAIYNDDRLVASAMDIDIDTVKKYKHEILKKTNYDNFDELIELVKCVETIKHDEPITTNRVIKIVRDR